ncbi:MAG: DNRLRE domain-containing protein [Deltaproteobacteria bacterium]|nr:DNRLRE domain-containing protein [Deltaproteobacteria bacterium]
MSRRHHFSPGACVCLVLATGCPTDDPASTDPSAETESNAEGSSGIGTTAATTTTGDAADETGTGGTVVVLELGPVDDVSSDEANPDTNSGDQDRLRIENQAGQSQQAFLRFAVDDIEGEILSASLQLVLQESSEYGGDIFAIPENDPVSGMQWTEDSITWNDSIPVEGMPIDSVGPLPSTGMVSFNLTGAVTLGAANSYAITTPSDDEVVYWSKESADPPVLFVTVLQP